MELDETVDGFCSAIVGSVGVPVGQELFLLLSQCPPEACDLGDRAGRHRGQCLLGCLASGPKVCVVVGRSEFVGDLPGDEQLLVEGVGGDGVVESLSLPFGEPVGVAAHDGADPKERVAFASAVPADLLLEPSTDLIDGAESELDDVESIEHSGGVFEHVIDGPLVALERIQSGDLYT